MITLFLDYIKGVLNLYRRLKRLNRGSGFGVWGDPMLGENCIGGKRSDWKYAMKFSRSYLGVLGVILAGQPGT
jgi:hypothetical protein